VLLGFPPQLGTFLSALMFSVYTLMALMTILGIILTMKVRLLLSSHSFSPTPSTVPAHRKYIKTIFTVRGQIISV
jgi:hypothetical protein